jgi:hypothetical protein
MIKASGKIQYEPYPMFSEGVYTATYKSVEMIVAEGEDWISIYSCESGNPNKGEVQEMIDLLRKDFKGKKLWGSVSLSGPMKHIYDKKGVQYHRLENYA